MYFVCDISSMRYVPSGRDKEFISYRNGAKRSYIVFVKQIYRTNEVSILIKQKEYVFEGKHFEKNDFIGLFSGNRYCFAVFYVADKRNRRQFASYAYSCYAMRIDLRAAEWINRRAVSANFACACFFDAALVSQCDMDVAWTCDIRSYYRVIVFAPPKAHNRIFVFLLDSFNDFRQDCLGHCENCFVRLKR